MDLNVEYGTTRSKSNLSGQIVNKDISKTAQLNTGVMELFSRDETPDPLPIAETLDINSINDQEFKKEFTEAVDNDYSSELGTKIAQELLRSLAPPQKMDELDTDDITPEWISQATELVTDLFYTDNLDKIFEGIVDKLLVEVSISVLLSSAVANFIIFTSDLF